MTLFTHEATADLDFSPRQKPSRLYRFMSRVAGWSWQWSVGIDIDQDGEVDGAGFMVRLELPGWIAAPIRRWTYAHMPEWMKAQHNDDISDVLLGSLLMPSATIGDFLGGVDIASGARQITWVEDRLNPRPWRLGTPE
jgi:hypothetical protein